MNDGLLLGIIALISYLAGAIPTAYLICIRKGINIFEFASGNMGATNVARALGVRAALWTAVIDLAKGIAPAAIGRLAFRDQGLETEYLCGAVAALAALVGHSWSIWVLLLTGKLRGGKAAGTTAGTWIALAPPLLTLVIFGTVAIMLYITRIMSLSVLVTVTVGVLGMWLFAALGKVEPILAVYGLAVLVLIFYKHRENIQRLRQGIERHVGGKAR